MWLVALSLLLSSTSLLTEFAADDHLHRVLSQAQPTLLGVKPRPFDLFVFASGDTTENRQLMDAGIFPWWAAPDVKLAFMRPVSSLVYRLDHLLWPDSAAAMQAHSLLWLGLSLLAVWHFYARFAGPRWVAALALALYALDDARGPTVGWISNRNALIALTLSVPTILWHDRWCKQRLRASVLWSVLALALGLLAGESAVASVGYLVAYAWHLDRRPWRTRLLSLVPYVVVVAAWRITYVALGYGVRASGVYVDAGTEPLTFLGLLAQRAPLLLTGQLGLPWSDLGVLYPFVGPRVPMMALLGTTAGLLLLALACAPLLKEDRLARFFLTGMLLATVPVCSTFPADRLLSFVGLGGMGFVARVMSHALTDSRRTRTVLVAGMFGVVHLVLGPLLLPLRARSMETVAQWYDLAERSVPQTADITDKTLILVSVPGDPFAAFIPIIRASRGQPHAARQRWLATGLTQIEIERLSARALRVTPLGGFVQFEIDRMMRSPERTFRVGQRIELDGIRIAVEAVTATGRPLTVRAEFDRDLEDPTLVWMRWDRSGFVPYAPPALGQRATLPAIEFLDLLGQATQAE